MSPRGAAGPTRSRRLLIICSLIAGALLVGVQPAAASRPTNGDVPTVSGMEDNGSVYVGATLYATAGRWSGVPVPTYSYRWQYMAADGTWPDIAGATDPTYTVQPIDLGHPLRVNVTALNSDGSAEQVSKATSAVTNAPPEPPKPPDPPPDILGSPSNSRVVSADGLLITRDVYDGSQHRQLGLVPKMTSDGRVQEPFGFGLDPGDEVPGGEHFLPRVTAAGRFMDPDFDSVLTLESRFDSTAFETGPMGMVLRSTSSDVLARGQGDPSGTLEGGMAYQLQDPNEDDNGRILSLTEVAGSGRNSNLQMTPAGSLSSFKTVAAANWTAVAVPASGAGAVAIVNRVSGRCLGTATGTDPSVQLAVASECAWGNLPAAQQWTSTSAGDVDGVPSGTLVNRANGLALTRDGQDVTVAPLATPPSSDQQWIQWEAPVASLGAGNSLLTGDDVPSYRFSANPLTYTMAAGDLDRVSEFGDTFQYHDEAVMAWVPNAGTPTPPTLRVVDYVSSGVVRPVPHDLDVALPAPGAMQNGEYMPGSLGLAVGDFDGDSLNEIAYTWQDSSGTFRVTMLEYRRNADQTRSLHVVGPEEGTPLFTGSGAPTPRLEAGLAEAKAGDFDGDGRDDLAIAFGGTPANGTDANPYVGVVSFTQDLGVRGQQYSAISSEALYTDGFGARGATRGLRLAPGLFRLDPDVGYTMERRQLAVAWTEKSGSDLATKVAAYSIDPDSTCTQATCALTVNELAKWDSDFTEPADEPGYLAPLSLAAGGFRGRGSGEDPPLWGIALGINDREDPTATPDGSLATYAVVPDNSSTTGFSLEQLQWFSLNPGEGKDGTTELYTVTAFDPTGASLALGAPAVVQVQGLRRATLVAAQPPTHADWDSDLTDPSTHLKGAFLDVSRFSNFTVTLGSTSTKTYQHTHTDDSTWNAGVTQSADVKGSFNNDLGVEATSASVEAKEKFKAKWTGTGGDFNNSTSQISSSLTQTSNDDDLFQGSVEDSTLYRYPILGGPLRDANGDPVPGTSCGQTCYGVYEVSIPGKVVPIATSGRSVDFFQPSWENGNALSYPVMSGGDIPTPDIGPYTYVDANGATQSVTAPLLKQEFGVGGDSTQATMTITGTTGSGNSSGGGNSWDLSGDVKATATYRAGPKAVNYAGSVSLDVGGFGGKSTSTNDTGQTINTSASAFQLNVPEIVPDNGYNIGTSYYYDTGGAARVSHAVDLTSNSQSKEWWADNYGRKPDPALNLPNRVILDTNQFNQQIVPHFATDARHQLIRGFRAFHTGVVDSPSFANKEYTTNPTVGDQVSFQVPVRNYSLDPASNVSVSFYAVPMKYDGAVEDVAGPPVAIGKPQMVAQIPAQGSVNVASPVWSAAVQQGVAGIQPWRIFVVLDEDNKVDEIHEWKDSNGPCPEDALENQPADGTVINGVMVDPITGQASVLACGQNNQGFGEISVSASAPSARTQAAARPMTVLDMATRKEPNAPDVNLTRGGVHTADPATDVLDENEVARVHKGELVHGVAYVGAKGESLYHQTVLVYDGPPATGKMVAVTTLRGATAADGHRVEFTWRADKVGKHTLYVKLLGHVAAGDDDLLTIPVIVAPPSVNTAPKAAGDAYSTRENRPLTVHAPGVLRNDRDPEGTKLTALRVSGPAHGSLHLNGDGSFTYTPSRRFAGTDSFTYRASDGPLASDPATVTITVRPLPVCQGREATIVGTRRRDVIRGTARADVIVAYGGNDTIRARGGNDRVCAGEGWDLVVGGAGRDRILGGLGGDRLHGDSDADRLDGGPGNDTLSGGPGNDILHGRAGQDRLLGGPGRNALLGGTGDDILLGGPDRDVMRGGPGRDLLLGGGGRDLLDGGPGRDLIHGGPGRDLIVGKPRGAGDGSLIASRDLGRPSRVIQMRAQGAGSPP